MVNETTKITVEATVNASVEKVWNAWNASEHIIKWNTASPEWHTPKAENDVREGGKFLFRMEAKDGSFGFDFGGVYNVVKPNEYLEYTLGDGRKVSITFKSIGAQTHVSESFDPESVNPPELQYAGWQSILDNFKKYVESI